MYDGIRALEAIDADCPKIRQSVSVFRMLANKNRAYPKRSALVQQPIHIAAQQLAARSDEKALKEWMRSRRASYQNGGQYIVILAQSSYRKYMPSKGLVTRGYSVMILEESNGRCSAVLLRVKYN
jgi:hypothetical protein